MPRPHGQAGAEGAVKSPFSVVTLALVAGIHAVLFHGSDRRL
jgi:hypothetical protein